MARRCGILAREPPEGRRARYLLTPAGEALRPTIEALRVWGDAWLPRAPAA